MSNLWVSFLLCFFIAWEAQLIEQMLAKKTWQSQMAPSEIMTILVLFHTEQYRNIKEFYEGHVKRFLKDAFPTLLSYSRFIEQKKRITMPMFFFMMSLPKTKTGIYFVDSTTIKVCHIKREKQHKVFSGLAKKSKPTMGWFFGFKLHILINTIGEIMALKFTKANVDDRQPVDDLTKGLFGKVFGDKGYLSKALRERLFERGVELATKARKNMKAFELADFDKLLLRKRAIVETVIDQLKNISQIEHTRHRSVHNFALNLIAGLTTYSLRPKKPMINVECHGLVLV
jgi:IS5 family transposase